MTPGFKVVFLTAPNPNSADWLSGPSLHLVFWTQTLFCTSSSSPQCLASRPAQSFTSYCHYMFIHLHNSATARTVDKNSSYHLLEICFYRLEPTTSHILHQADVPSKTKHIQLSPILVGHISFHIYIQPILQAVQVHLLLWASSNLSSQDISLQSMN